MKVRIVVVLMIAGTAMGLVRYQTGRVEPGVYTAVFDCNDPAYRFFQTNYGDPNVPKMQSAPDDWVLRFGDNERTMLLHAVSELRMVVASQGARLRVLEKWKDEQAVLPPGLKGRLDKMDPDEVMDFARHVFGLDPNE